MIVESSQADGTPRRRLALWVRAPWAAMGKTLPPSLTISDSFCDTYLRIPPISYPGPKEPLGSLLFLEACHEIRTSFAALFAYAYYT